MKTAVLFSLLLASSCASLIRNHQFWYDGQKAIVESNLPYADITWNYCDLKCLYFEHYYPTVDFVYITFATTMFNPTFAACFTRTNHTNGSATYSVWNATVTNNTWYQTYCGGDYTNFWKQAQNASLVSYTVSKIHGIGIGNFVPVY